MLLNWYSFNLSWLRQPKLVIIGNHDTRQRKYGLNWTTLDNFGPKILKVSAPFIVSPLTYIFNRIIDWYLSQHIKKCKSVSNFLVRGKMSPYKLQTYIRNTCYIQTNWKTYLKTYVSVLGKIQSSTWCPIWF